MMPGGIPVAAEPFGNEAHAFVKDMIMQREVEIVVESIDKGGNFIGWCFEGTTNISLALVDEVKTITHQITHCVVSFFRERSVINSAKLKKTLLLKSTSLHHSR